jgi:hypothetical protein
VAENFRAAKLREFAFAFTSVALRGTLSCAPFPGSLAQTALAAATLLRLFSSFFHFDDSTHISMICTAGWIIAFGMCAAYNMQTDLTTSLKVQNSALPSFQLLQSGAAAGG